MCAWLCIPSALSCVLVECGRAPNLTNLCYVVKMTFCMLLYLFFLRKYKFSVFRLLFYLSLFDEKGKLYT